ncbi:helicase [Helicobacter magdeburgensis]|nr:helicase [Helicobacter magdeburgensis]
MKKDNDIQQQINSIEKDIKSLKKHINNALDVLEQKLIYLRELTWNRDSKKESSKMYKVLENDKPSTIVRSNVGDVVVDREFMEKEIQKHLDNPALRGMVTTEEMLSYPKIAKNVEAEYNAEINDHTWKVKANDESVLAYGSREYVKDDKEINRLLTAHSKTERGERTQRQADRVSSATYFNDPDFRGSASAIIPQSPNNDEETYMIPNQNTSNTHFITQDSVSNLSLEEQISLAKENQKTLNAMPKASDIDKDNTQESTQTQDTTQRVETQSQNSIRRMK